MPMSSVRLQHTASRHNTTLVRLQHPPHPLFHQKTFRVVHPHQHLHPQHTLCAASNTAMSTTTPPVEFFQYNINLKARPRGCHVVTREILAGLKDLQHVEVGLANFFIQHTSASLTINENASPDVPLDLNVSRGGVVGVCCCCLCKLCRCCLQYVILCTSKQDTLHDNIVHTPPT